MTQHDARLQESLRFHILAAQRQGARMLEEQLKPYGLTPSQAEVLRVLHDYEPITLRELGQMLVCESGSPSRLAASMAASGLIERKEHPADGRALQLTLTAAGREYADRVRETEEKLYASMEAIATDDEIRQIVRLLGRFLRHTSFHRTLSKRNLLAVPENDMAKND